jgi:hypothetical protein
LPLKKSAHHPVAFLVWVLNAGYSSQLTRKLGFQVRVIAWVLNGVDVLVENATLKTNEDGIAHNTFWVTNRRGRKLSQKRAEFLAERLGDYITYCTPDNKVHPYIH